MQNELVVTHVARAQEVGSGCLIVEIDKLKILVNFGTSQDLDISIYTHIEQIEGITHILLCSSEISAIGGLIHLQALGVSVPIIGTVPIKILGRLEILERVEVLKQFHKDARFKEKIEEVFDAIVPLKYMQNHELTDEISVGPLNSGSSVGGAIWKILKNDHEWIIMDKINHRREAHLDGLDFQHIKKPEGVVVNSRSVAQDRTTRKARDKSLIKAVTSTVNNNGKVLIPTSFTQLLEIVMTLSNDAETRGYQMSLYSFYGRKYFDNVKTILEWMGASILQKFHQEKENPFNLANMEFREECPEKRPDSSVIFIIDPTGGGGFSPAVLPEFLKSAKNTVILTGKTQKYEGAISISPVKYTRLTETEAKKHRKKTKEEERKKEAEKKIENLIKQKKEDSSEEEEDRKQILSKFWYEVENEIETKERMSSYADSDFGIAKPEITFPGPTRRKPSDEYGEPIQIEKEKEAEAQSAEAVPEKKEKKMYKMSVLGAREIEVACQVKRVLFTGECDAFNLRTILAGVSPRNVVVFGENETHRKVFSKYLLYTSTAEQILELCTRREVQTEKNAIPVKLGKDLLATIKMQRLGGGLIGCFNGQVIKEEKAHMLVPQDGEDARGVCLSAVKLSDLRQAFVEAKIRAEIVEDKLVVNGNIFVYFEGEYLKIDGELSKEFYAVKKVVSKNIAFLG